ncbi:MAG: ATP phosphoribosyltransferase regulatory subunit [Candidatus Paceibacterota bacterium]|jgi:histidyl-tRNA synthetase
MPNSARKPKKIPAPSYVSYEDIDIVGEAALFYGFTPLKTLTIHHEDVERAKSISEGEVVVDHDNHEIGASVRLDEKISLLSLYDKERMFTLPQPLMFFYRKNTRHRNELHYGLDILGADKSIAEAVLVKAALAILSETGEQGLHVEINSIGDKESLARFTKEITAYYRKHLADLPPACRPMVKNDVFALLGCNHDKCKELADNCPKAINFLSEKSRTHFKEVLEYLETLEVPYSINNTLVANRDYCSETIFEIRRDEADGHPLAIGIRYDTLAKRIGHKKEVASVGVSIAVPSRHVPKSKTLTKSKIDKILHPSICFMQLGFEAKLLSLSVLEVLRQHRIPLVHSIMRDKMAGQIGLVEKSRAPVVMIMGKKEAMEKSVIVRDAETRSQDSILITDTPAKLRKYKI